MLGDYRQLARPRLEDLSVHTDDVAHIELLKEVVVGRFERIFPRVDLGAPSPVLHVEEAALAEVPEGDDPAREGNKSVFLLDLLGGQLAELLVDIGAPPECAPFLGIGVYAGCLEKLLLLLPDAQKLIDRFHY